MVARPNARSIAGASVRRIEILRNANPADPVSCAGGARPYGPTPPMTHPSNCSAHRSQCWRRARCKFPHDNAARGRQPTPHQWGQNSPTLSKPACAPYQVFGAVAAAFFRTGFFRQNPAVSLPALVFRGLTHEQILLAWQASCAKPLQGDGSAAIAPPPTPIANITPAAAHVVNTHRMKNPSCSRIAPKSPLAALARPRRGMEPC